MKELEKILYWLLDNKHNLDSGICEQITGRADKDYLLGLKKIVEKSSAKILSLIKVKIDDTKKDIDKYISEIFTINLPETIDVGQDILTIIKNRLEIK